MKHTRIQPDVERRRDPTFDNPAQAISDVAIATFIIVWLLGELVSWLFNL